MYVFDNAWAHAASRLDALADVFDPETIRHLDAVGVGEGWHCLEVGGGRGSIASWLGQRVGPRGRVLATDIDPRHLGELGLSNVEVRRHDIVRDALPESAFDLVHTRLVLCHVADPATALTRMVRAVKPGGWIVVEDFEVIAEGSGADEQLSKTAAAMRAITHREANLRLGRSLARRLRDAGLTNVDTEGRSRLYRGGSTGAAVMRLSFEQLRPRILATGQVTADELEADIAALADPDFEMRSPILWTAWGQRPHA